ncbi:MAG TPA: P-II family nitrogen regulator [Chryseolinea sp.]|nr:P-II family nitrogen regulator [Chryseolinea sp.]HPH47120.1 P-II family nitrogen regulator [Chryseolinea sp.]HPM32068.1 P-II family nitrogen regulator [Chryseolinea sp.]
MKFIIAIIRENQLDQVREALIDAGITRISVSNVSGHGRQSTSEEIYRGQIVVPNLTANIRIEIALNDEFVDTACNAIINATKANENGLVGSGKIFILPLEEVIRLRTDERGPKAI